ncbi:MAG: glycosyl transferase, group 1 [Herbinix sp.]|jgi:glycosyltransferase involved in cell wall biosynthesis|nr:glycosyl transferase, group 1 [Herbinix sp.]
MKVLMIGSNPSVRGGITSVVTQLLDHDWRKDGIDMKFIPTYLEAGTCKKLLYFIQAYIKIVWSLITFKPDLLHIHMSYKGSFQRKYMIHKLCKRFGRKDIIHLHGSEFKKYYEESRNKTKSKIKELLRDCDSMMVLGEEWDTQVKGIEPAAKTVVVRNAVKIPSETVEWCNDFCQVLFLGVLTKRKGVHDLLDAVAMLEKQGALNKIKFVIAGSGVEEEALKKKCSEMQLEGYVEFLGWTAGKKKIELLKHSQVLVLPSYNEGLPIAILEAISFGLPVISTRVGDISSSVIDCENGYLITPGDVSSLATMIGRIISDKELYLRLSRNARKLAEEKFSEEKFFDLLKEHYFNLYEENKNKKVKKITFKK